MTGVEGGSHYAHASHEREAFTASGEGVRSLLEERTGYERSWYDWKRV